VVSVAELNARGPGVSEWGTLKFSDGICKYLSRMSQSFVSITHLFVVSVYVNFTTVLVTLVVNLVCYIIGVPRPVFLNWWFFAVYSI